MNFTEVQAILDSSSWSDNAKSGLKNSLPQLGKAALLRTLQVINEPFSEKRAERFNKIISLEPQWYELLKNNKGYQIKDFILNNYSLFSSDMLGLLAIITDIRGNNSLNSYVTEDLSNVFDCIELDYLDEQSSGDVVRLLRDRAYYAATICDLNMEIKRYCYMKSIESPSDKEMQAFKLALESNVQNIGAVPIVLDSGKQPPQIKNWILNFLTLGAKSTDRSVFNVAHFMTHEASIKSLTITEQKVLSSVLKLYNWFFAPAMTANEMDSYNAQRISLFETVCLHMEPEVNAGLDLASGDRERMSDFGDGVKAPPPKVMQDIALKAPVIPRGGLVLDRQTNIVLSEEEQRLKSLREEQKASIQPMLEELRKRKQQ